MYRLHVSARRRRVTLRALFAVLVFFAGGFGFAGVCAGVGVLGGGGVVAGGRFGGVDEGVEAGGAARGWVLVLELEAVEALQMAPVVAHGEREARPLHGARGAAAAGGLRARTQLSSRVEVARLWCRTVTSLASIGKFVILLLNGAHEN